MVSGLEGRSVDDMTTRTVATRIGTGAGDAAGSGANVGEDNVTIAEAAR